MSTEPSEGAFNYAPSMTEEEYTYLTRARERAMSQLLLELRYFLEDTITLSACSIEHRIKTYDSAYRKAIQKQRPIEESRDLAGMRVVVQTTTDVETLVRFFERKVLGDDLKILSDDLVNRPDGYRGRHLVVEMPPHYSRTHLSCPIEVQLRTLLENSFDSISRHWRYRASYELSTEFEERFRRVSLELNRLDDELAALQDQVTVTQADTPDTALTPHSYVKIASERFGEPVSLDTAVDSVYQLVGLGMRTNGDLREFLWSERIADVFQRIEEHTHPHVEWVKPLCRGHFGYITSGVRLKYLENLLAECDALEEAGGGGEESRTRVEEVREFFTT